MIYKSNLILLTVFLFLFNFVNIYTIECQVNKPPAKNKSINLNKETNNLTETPVIIYNSEQKVLQDEMEKLKIPGDLEMNGEKIVQIQKQIENINGSTFTDQNPNPFGKLIRAEDLGFRPTQNLSNTSVLNPNNSPLATAIQVEQTGASAGKIWLAIGYANGDTGVLARPDTLALFYSTNNGSTFNLYAMIAFSDHNKFTFDDMDMEIIENSTGTKYIHVVFGYQTNGGYGQRLIGYTVISTPTLTYAGTTLIFPGYNINHQYFQARITSDNVRYPSNPYISIVITQDSIAIGQSNIMAKMCRVLNPYTVSPAITYLPKSIYTSAPGSHGYEVMTDVVNYHNGIDSLLFVLSNYPNYEGGLYFYKAYSNTVLYPVPSGSYTPSGDNIEYARVACGGGTNQKQIMITYSDNYLNTGDFDQWILYTFDAVNWINSSVEYSSANSSRKGDIIARRNINGSFSISFKNYFGNMENVGAYISRYNSFYNTMYNVNTNFANSYCSPKPGFCYSGDSVLNVWSDYYRTNVTTGGQATNVIIKAAVQGYYNENTDLMSQYLPVNVLLANQNPPYNIVDTGLAYLDYEYFNNVFTFKNAPVGDYYLVLKNYNAIETWSSVPFPINAGATLYDFTNQQSNTYGNNVIQKGTRWCIYNGDINQDGVIDLDDMQQIDNDAYNFVMQQAYFSDLNGDNIVDITDIVIADNNAFNFVSSITP